MDSLGHQLSELDPIRSCERQNHHWCGNTGQKHQNSMGQNGAILPARQMPSLSFLQFEVHYGYDNFHWTPVKRGGAQISKFKPVSDWMGWTFLATGCPNVKLTTSVRTYWNSITPDAAFTDMQAYCTLTKARKCMYYGLLFVCLFV